MMHWSSSGLMEPPAKFRSTSDKTSIPMYIIKWRLTKFASTVVLENKMLIIESRVIPFASL